MLEIYWEMDYDLYEAKKALGIRMKFYYKQVGVDKMILNMQNSPTSSDI